ncbi:MAG: hypothetical protein LAO07_15435 [Acidobacteriia bacterium]|nr:hypothetical protein [Terriglobia bacterium]
MAPDGYEESLQEFLVTALYARIGEPGTLTGEGKTARFELKKSLGGGSCEAEGALDYVLPSGRSLSHKNDILISLPRKKYVAVELKWVSSRTSAFKARAYDMLHLKQAFGQKLRGIMVYLRTGQGGLSADQAQAISYPFDVFFGIENQDPQNPAVWVPILDRIEGEIQARE